MEKTTLKSVRQATVDQAVRREWLTIEEESLLKQLRRPNQTYEIVQWEGC